MKKLLIGAAALITATAPLAASAQPFHGARSAAVAYHGGGRGGFGGYRGGGWRGGNGGAAIAAGLFGLAVGAAIADQPEYGPAYGYGYGDCGWQTQAVRGPYGQIRYEQVQVCN